MKGIEQIDKDIREVLLEGGEELVIWALENNQSNLAIQIVKELLSISTGEPLDSTALVQAAMETRSHVPTMTDPQKRERLLDLTSAVGLLASATLAKPPSLRVK